MVATRDTVSYTCWDGRKAGGKAQVFNLKRRGLFREINVEPDGLTDAGFV